MEAIFMKTYIYYNELKRHYFRSDKCNLLIKQENLIFQYECSMRKKLKLNHNTGV